MTSQTQTDPHIERDQRTVINRNTNMSNFRNSIQDLLLKLLPSIYPLTMHTHNRWLGKSVSEGRLFVIVYLSFNFKLTKKSNSFKLYK